MEETKNSKTVPVSKEKRAQTSFVLGIISLVAWYIPLFGLPVSIVGLVYGIKGIDSEKKKKAILTVVKTFAEENAV